MTVDYSEPHSSVYNNLHALRALAPKCSVPPCTQSAFLEHLRLHDSLALFLSMAERDTTAVTTRMTTRGLVIYAAKTIPPTLAHREAGEMLRRAILHPDATESSLMSVVLRVCGSKVASRLHRLTNGMSWDDFAKHVDVYSQVSASTGRTTVTKNVSRLRLKFRAPDLFENLKNRYQTILNKAAALQVVPQPEECLSAGCEGFLLLSTLSSVLADSLEGMVLCEEINPEERRKLTRLRRDLLDIVRYRTAVLNVLNRVRVLGPFAERLNVIIEWVSNDPTNSTRCISYPTHISAYETARRRAEMLGRGNLLAQTSDEFYSHVKEPKQPPPCATMRVHPAIVLLLYMDQRPVSRDTTPPEVPVHQVWRKPPPKLQTIGCSERCGWETALWISCYNNARDKQWSIYGSRLSPGKGCGGWWWKFPLVGADVDASFVRCVERELDEHLVGLGLMGPMGAAA